jgi:hypothetical protein
MQAGNGVVDVSITPTAVTVPTAVDTEIGSYESAAQLLVVDSDEAYAASGELLLGIKDLRKEIADFFEPLIRKAHEAHRALTTARNEKELPLLRAEVAIKGKLDAYHREQLRLRQEEADRQRREAEAEERARRDAEAAAMRAEAEALAKSDPVQAVDVLAAAEAIAETPVFVPTVAPAALAMPKVVGISHKESWEAEVVDLMALVRHVAAHPEHESLLTPNLTALRQMAKSLKSRLSIPGVRAYDKGGVAAASTSRRSVVR